MEERSEVREEGAEGAVRDGVVPGRPPPPSPGFGVRDSGVCESLCESCPHCARVTLVPIMYDACWCVTPVCDTLPPTAAPFALYFPFLARVFLPCPFILVMILCCNLFLTVEDA